MPGKSTLAKEIRNLSPTGPAADRGMALTRPQVRIHDHQWNINMFQIETRLSPKASCTKIVPMVGRIVDSGPVGEARFFQREDLANRMVEAGAKTVADCRGRQSSRFVAASRFAIHHRVLSFNPGIPALTHFRMQLGIIDFIQRVEVKVLRRESRRKPGEH